MLWSSKVRWRNCPNAHPAYPQPPTTHFSSSPYPGTQLQRKEALAPPESNPAPRTPGNSTTIRPPTLSQFLLSLLQTAPPTPITISKPTTLVEAPCPRRGHVGCHNPRYAGCPHTAQTLWCLPRSISPITEPSIIISWHPTPVEDYQLYQKSQRPVQLQPPVWA